MIGWFFSVFGIKGAVLITLLATVISKAVAIVRAKRLMQVSAARILPWGSLSAIGAASAAAALPTWVVKTQVHLPPIPLLMLMGAIFASSYIGLVFGFGLLSEGEKLAVSGWLRRPALVKVREAEESGT
jgi:CHASE2 domain-containing sensor protein